MPKTTSQNKRKEFTELSKQKRTGLLRELWFFLRHNKKWWLLPIFFILIVLSVLILLSGTAIAPFLYPLF